MSLRYAIYCRVSTDAQERDGTSLETQEAACRDYVERLGGSVVQCAREAGSGYALDRPELARLRRLIRDGEIDVFLCHAVDRWARQQNHIGILFDELQSSNTRLEFVLETFENTAVGRFILAARAFVAEVEREKITERTMRGKAQRARSGKLPQGTGKGCYGYQYDPETGRRTIVPEQAAVVAWIFADFAAGVSIMSITNRLNDRGIRTLTGKQWYGASVFHLLENETYTGRTVYRRTEAKQVCDPKTGRKHRQVTVRDEADTIEVPGVTPAIIAVDTFAAVQRRLQDPERRSRGKRTHEYELSQRAKCLRCGRAIVGQTLSKTFRYYKCRRAFAGPRHDRCDSGYIRADGLEQAVRKEIAVVLANPSIIAAEYSRLNAGSNDERTAGEQQLKKLDEQKRRLGKLYQLGEIELEEYQADARSLKNRRGEVEQRLHQVERVQAAPTLEELETACDGVRSWIEQAEGNDLELLLDALQIRLLAEPGRAELSGVIPTDYAPLDGHADVCAVVAYCSVRVQP